MCAQAVAVRLDPSLAVPAEEEAAKLGQL